MNSNALKTFIKRKDIRQLSAAIALLLTFSMLALMLISSPLAGAQKVYRARTSNTPEYLYCLVQDGMYLILIPDPETGRLAMALPPFQAEKGMIHNDGLGGTASLISTSFLSFKLSLNSTFSSLEKPLTFRRILFPQSTLRQLAPEQWVQGLIRGE
jgi:hypothetical protein